MVHLRDLMTKTTLDCFDLKMNLPSKFLIDRGLNFFFDSCQNLSFSDENFETVHFTGLVI